jgi:LacI family transcriptional regulator
MAPSKDRPRRADADNPATGRPRIQDVARRAGVAIGTVSNVLNNPELVAVQTRLKVEAAIAELGFVRNSAARALAARRTDTVGLILIDIARGAESAAGQAQLKLLLANSDSTRTKQDNYLELFDQARVAGVLLTPLEEPLEMAHAVLGHGRPVVLVIATSPDPLTCGVMVNEELGGYLAATHLLEEGARRLVFLAGFPELRLIRRRLAGVERAVAEAGASLSVVEAPNLQIGTGREVGCQLLVSQSVDGPVDGLVCPSDLLAVGVIQAATELGIRVPDELMVVGYDDNHFASESSIPVSSVSLPGYRMGELAIELLLEEIDQGSAHVHRTIMLDPHLIPRRSTLKSPL